MWPRLFHHGRWEDESQQIQAETRQGKTRYKEKLFLYEDSQAAAEIALRRLCSLHSWMFWRLAWIRVFVFLVMYFDNWSYEQMPTHTVLPSLHGPVQLHSVCSLTHVQTSFYMGIWINLNKFITIDFISKNLPVFTFVLNIHTLSTQTRELFAPAPL